jgi:hypothetical protein
VHGREGQIEQRQPNHDWRERTSKRDGPVTTPAKVCGMIRRNLQPSLPLAFVTRVGQPDAKVSVVLFFSFSETSSVVLRFRRRSLLTVTGLRGSWMESL